MKRSAQLNLTAFFKGLTTEDQETIIKIIDAMLAKQQVESALVSVDR